MCLCLGSMELAFIVQRGLREKLWLPRPPQTPWTMSASRLTAGAALPPYQTRIHIAPSYAGQPRNPSASAHKSPDAQTVRALRGASAQGKARPGPSSPILAEVAEA